MVASTRYHMIDARGARNGTRGSHICDAMREELSRVSMEVKYAFGYAHFFILYNGQGSTAKLRMQARELPKLLFHAYVYVIMRFAQAPSPST